MWNLRDKIALSSKTRIAHLQDHFATAGRKGHYSDVWEIQNKTRKLTLRPALCFLFVTVFLPSYECVNRLCVKMDIAEPILYLLSSLHSSRLAQRLSLKPYPSPVGPFQLSIIMIWVSVGILSQVSLAPFNQDCPVCLTVWLHTSASLIPVIPLIELRCRLKTWREGRTLLWAR